VPSIYSVMAEKGPLRSDGDIAARDFSELQAGGRVLAVAFDRIVTSAILHSALDMRTQAIVTL